MWEFIVHHRLSPEVDIRKLRGPFTMNRREHLIYEVRHMDVSAYARQMRGNHEDLVA